MSHEPLTAGALEFAVPSRGWRVALIISVLLHLLVLFALLQIRAGSVRMDIADAPQQLIRLSMRSPVAVQREIASTSSPASPSAPAETITSIAESPELFAPVEQQVEVGTAPVTSPTPSLPQGQGTLTQDDIRASIAKFSADFKGQLTADWLSECQRYRERYSTRECPQQGQQDSSALDDGKQIATSVFAGITRADRHRGLTNSLLQQNETLANLVEEGGVLGSLARERYYLNREYVFYLNGNFNFGAWNFVKSSNPGNGNLEFMRSFMQFQCKDSPCIYEFTGIGAKRATDDSRDSTAAASDGN